MHSKNYASRKVKTACNFGTEGVYVATNSTWTSTLILLLPTSPRKRSFPLTVIPNRNN